MRGGPFGGPGNNRGNRGGNFGPGNFPRGGMGGPGIDFTPSNYISTSIIIEHFGP